MTSPEADASARALERVRTTLRRAGATDEEIDRAAHDGVLDLFAVDRLIVPVEHRYTPRQVSDATGLPLESLKRLWRALGFLEPSDDEPVLTDTDVDAARTLQYLLSVGITDPDSALQLARVIGSSMARIAEAGMLRGAEALGAGDDSVLAADAFAAMAEELLPAMARLLEFTWRRHMQAVARRTLVRAATGGALGAGATLAVGFVDMVGFTLLSQHLRDDELSAVVRRFEEISYEIVTRHGGRVVKTIGDEAMFVVDDVTAAARIGVELAEAYSDDDLLSDVRVGLAAGPVLERDGDYFGPVVNLASRIVGIAEPGTVLMSDEFHRRLQASPGHDFVAKPLRPRALKDVGTVQLWSCRRRGEEPSAGGTGPRAARRERLSRLLRDLEEVRAVGERILASGKHAADPVAPPQPGHGAGPDRP